MNVELLQNLIRVLTGEPCASLAEDDPPPAKGLALVEAEQWSSFYRDGRYLGSLVFPGLDDPYFTTEPPPAEFGEEEEGGAA